MGDRSTAVRVWWRNTCAAHRRSREVYARPRLVLVHRHSVRVQVGR